jgi:septal ring factor EnvC (AmiA/AmiB activator)
MMMSKPTTEPLNICFGQGSDEGYCASLVWLEVLEEQLECFGIPELSLKEIDQFLSLVEHDLWKRPEFVRVIQGNEYVEDRLKSQQQKIKRLERKRVEHATKNSMMSKEIQKLKGRIIELEALDE